MPFGKTARMVVAVDPSTRLYGYTMQQPQLNLERLYVSVVFQPWREGFVYKNNAWSFYNEFYTPPTVLKTYYRPARQAEEGAAEEAFTAQQIKAYAYVADTTDWYIASYDDAVAGKITRKEGTDTRTTPNFQAYYESASGLYGMEVTATPLMAVGGRPCRPYLCLYQVRPRPRRRIAYMARRLPAVARTLEIRGGRLADGR